jgi:glutamate-1-semialdehyde 2,1-aminomutase
MKLEKSIELFTKGQKHLVGSVNSPVRAFKSVGGVPIFIDKAKGSKIYDVDGNEYIDFVLSYGPMIMGHRHSFVEKTVKRFLRNGYSFGASTKGEIIMAQMVCEAFPGMDKVRFVNSGTEAVLSAIRLARAFTKKNKIIKFSGCYHGHSDALLVAAGSGLATLSLPGSQGVPEDAVKNTLIAEYNNLDSVEKHLRENKDVAGIILEPIAGNMGVVKPSKDFIAGLQSLASSYDVLIIADEVMTGYRSQYGGAQELIGLKADITCLGKVVGGGFPVGAYGARNEIMEMVAPLGGMYQAGTLSGNPIAMACGIATLKALSKRNPYADFNKTAAFLEREMKSAAKENGVDLQVNRFGSMINPFFTSEKVVDFKTAQTCDTNKFKTFFWKMMENGVFLPPSQFESWFLSTAMTKRDIYKVRTALKIAMKAVAKKHNK